MKNGHKIILLIFAALILAILTSCSRVESLTEPESSEDISCEYITVSNGGIIDNEDSLKVLVYLCSGAEYINNSESCYLPYYEIITVMQGTDSQTDGVEITSLNLNLNDSLIMINNDIVISCKNMIVNYGRR